MIKFLGLIYGIHLALLVYLFAYLTARGILGQKGMSFLIVLVKYFVYWKAITFGFQYLPGGWVVTGMTVGIFSSLPVVYFLTRSK